MLEKYVVCVDKTQKGIVIKDVVKNGNIWMKNIFCKIVENDDLEYDEDTGMFNGTMVTYRPVLDFTGSALILLNKFLERRTIGPRDFITVYGYAFTDAAGYTHIRVGFEAKGDYCVESKEVQKCIVFNSASGNPVKETTDYSRVKLNHYLPTVTAKKSPEKKPDRGMNASRFGKK